MKKVAIVGASGGLGLALIHACHTAGEVSVIAVVRDESKLSENIRKEVDTVVAGNATEATTVAETLSHSPDIVVIAVGQKDTKQQQTIRTDVTRAYVNGMRDNPAKLIVISSLGAGESGMQTNWFLRTFILGKVLKRVIEDHNAQEKLVRDELPAERWLIVRPTALNDNDAKGAYEVQESANLRSAKISRKDVASFVAKQIKGEGELYWGKMIAITW